MTRYMVIETFRCGAAEVYRRFNRHGRMLPDGLHYIDSWLAAEGNRCWQLMETADPALFATWTARWADLVDFEIVALGEKPG